MINFQENIVKGVKKLYKFIGFVDENYRYEYEKLPDDAKLINMEQLNSKSFIVGLVGMLIDYGILIFKQYGLYNGESVLNKPFIPLGIVMGVVVIPLAYIEIIF